MYLGGQWVSRVVLVSHVIVVVFTTLHVSVVAVERVCGEDD